MFRQILLRAGLEIRRTPRAPDVDAPAPNFTDLAAYWRTTRTIPGMSSDELYRMLYTLCVTQDLPGDVLEVGCWQGKSTSYLARAVKDSKNGLLHVVDTFEGNPDKQHAYRVRGRRADSIESAFRGHMKSLGLMDVIRVHRADSATATHAFQKQTLRLVFLDGDHSAKAVRRDIAQLLPLVKPGGWMVLDDYSENFPTVVGAAHETLRQLPEAKGFAIPGAFAIQASPLPATSPPGPTQRSKA